MHDARTTAKAAAMLGLALGAGCAAPDDKIAISVPEDSWRDFDPIHLTARLGPLDGPAPELAIAHQDEVVGKGPAVVGGVVAVPIDGRPCAVTIVRAYELSDSDVPAHLKKATTKELRNRTFRGLDLSLACPDGPVPATPASLRGSKPKRSMLPAVPGLVVGAAAGTFARGDRKGGESLGTAMLLLLVAIGAAVGVAWTQLDGGYRITGAILGAGTAIAGLVGARLWHRGRPHGALAWLGGLVAGMAVLALLSPAWGVAGPIGALALGVGAAVVGAVVAVMVKPLV